MKTLMKALMAAGTVAICAAAGPTAANADVIRIGVVVVDNKADWDANTAATPKVLALLKQAKGVKAVYSIEDPEKMTVGTVSVFGTEAEVAAVTDSAEWKAVLGPLNSKSRSVQILKVGK